MRQLALVLGAIALSLAAGAADAGPIGACPPGLAKKSPACLPPGQAKKAARPADDTYILRIGDRRYRIGDRLEGRGYHYVTRPDLYGLAPLGDGSRYVIAGNNLLRVDRDTFELLALIRAVDAILD